MNSGRNRRGVGCLLALAIYIPTVFISYLLTVPDEVTGDFTGGTSRIFSVATVTRNADSVDYERTTLETIEERNPESPSLAFQLPKRNVVIKSDNIYHVNVLENHDDWQLIEFNYSNTYTSKSVYRAYADHVEPVSFQMTSHVGQGMVALAMIIPVYFIAWLITRLRR